MELIKHKLENLLVFSVLYECKSMTKAERILGKSRSTIRSSLDVLKQVLNDNLFVASAGGQLEPTPLANRIFEDVQEIMQASLRIQSASASVKYLLNDKHIRISCVPYFFTFSPRVIDTLHGHDMDIEVSFEMTTARNRAEQLQRLNAGELDILVDFESRLFDRCKGVSVWKDDYSVVYSPDLPSGDLDTLITQAVYIKSGIPAVDEVVMARGARCGIEKFECVQLISSLLFSGEYFTVLPSMVVASWASASAMKHLFKALVLEKHDGFGVFSVNAYWNPLLDDAKVSLIKDAIRHACYYQSVQHR